MVDRFAGLSTLELRALVISVKVAMHQNVLNRDEREVADHLRSIFRAKLIQRGEDPGE